MASAAWQPGFASRGLWTGQWTGKTLVYGFLVLFTLYYIVPLAVVFLNSFRDLQEITTGSLIGIPRSVNFSYWGEAWDEICIGGICEGIRPYFWSSFKMVVPATIISTALGAINGYALSKWRFKGSEVLFGAITLGVFIPGQMVLLPWAITLGNLGLTNTTTGLVLIHVVQGLSFTTLFCRNYYVNIPEDLIKAILIVTVIWQFTNIWNEFLFAVTFASGDSQPITAALIALSASGTTTRFYNIESAAVIMAALPTLLVYLFGGKYFMRGLTAGAIK
jgi:glucose/mannose transport system permease protein